MQHKPLISTVPAHHKYLVSVRLEAEMTGRWYHWKQNGSMHSGIIYFLGSPLTAYAFNQILFSPNCSQIPEAIGKAKKKPYGLCSGRLVRDDLVWQTCTTSQLTMGNRNDFRDRVKGKMSPPRQGRPIEDIIKQNHFFYIVYYFKTQWAKSVYTYYKRAI